LRKASSCSFVLPKVVKNPVKNKIEAIAWPWQGHKWPRRTR